MRGGPEVLVDGEIAEGRHGGDIEISGIAQVGFCSGKRGPRRQVESVLHEPHLPGMFCRHRDHMRDGKWMVPYVLEGLMAPGLTREMLLLVLEVRLK